ncbi:hypothetical protein [Chitinimonas sp. BJB300]|uniref:hypothetical protein n=1 Tax=Chitinimonas sp. BJB300 TaxID=1559339 RepID=UPI000C0D983F|nr:hypothetical protein [Chitinimonas sp. BJB300]PHV11882.1 hypothetical protein CSQ89_08455 [Chitinimonas sp. BJB300]TSJ91462.1 hypothetical protein FG002_004070 [Chitinimonas sp. BJB300]
MKYANREYAVAGVVAGILLAGCSSLHTTVLPRENGLYELTATASTAREALDGAIKQANKTCDNQGKRLIVINNDDQSSSELEQTAKNVANKLLKAAGNGTFRFDTDVEGKIYMLFKCE